MYAWQRLDRHTQSVGPPISIGGYALGTLALLLGLQATFRFNLVSPQGGMVFADILAIVVLKMLLAIGQQAV